MLGVASSTSRKAKGAALLLKVTQQEEKIQSLSQDLKAAVVQAAAEQKELIEEVQQDLKKVLGRLQKAESKIGCMDDQLGDLLDVVTKQEEAIKSAMVPEPESEDDSADEGLTAAER